MGELEVVDLKGHEQTGEANSMAKEILNRHGCPQSRTDFWMNIAQERKERDRWRRETFSSARVSGLVQQTISFDVYQPKRDRGANAFPPNITLRDAAFLLTNSARTSPDTHSTQVNRERALTELRDFFFFSRTVLLKSSVFNSRSLVFGRKSQRR